MAQVQGIPYRRHGPSAALREFLDPLDPGDYFDCGPARLHGLDDALLEEARQRGREIGDDDFLLVATEEGLYFCRPSISFAISASWDEITLIRPRGDDPVVLPVTWPRHGELKFTVSKRLAGNIFRRWLQLRMHVVRQARESGRRLNLSKPVAETETGVGTGTGTETGSARSAGSGVETGAGTGTEAADGPERVEFTDDQDDVELVDTDTDTDTPTPAPTPADSTEPAETAPAETSDDLPLFEPVVARATDETLADDQLQRLAIPRPATSPPSWVGSAVSVAASLVVISTVVLIAATSVSVWRGVTGPNATTTAAGAATPPTTIDHERFRSSSDPVRDLAADGSTSEDGLAPSSAGGASQSIPSSSQQLLAVPADDDGAVASGTGDPNAALRCNSNYSGCIPDVDDTAGADVDCVGQGDGPYFADAEVMVLGEDVYGLDSDGDRVACEADQLTGGSSASDALSAGDVEAGPAAP